MRAVRWRETPQGVFGRPTDLGGGPLAPALGSATLRDGRQLLLGLRLAALEGRGGSDLREIVVLEQRAPGGEFGAWTGLGNPETDPVRGRRIGVPVAVTARDGQVHLFVRDADQGISTRVRGLDGRWSPWRGLGGGPVQDGLTAVVGEDGGVHVYAPGRDTVHHWTPEGPTPPIGLPVPADAVAAAGGRLYYRAPASSALTATAGPPIHFPGYGPVTADGPYLLGRDTDGTLQLLHRGRIQRAARDLVTLDGPALRATAHGPVAAGLSPRPGRGCGARTAPPARGPPARSEPGPRTSGHAKGPVRPKSYGPLLVLAGATRSNRQGNYLTILVTWPAPTVRPPSRMANFRPSSMATGWMSSTFISVLSPGMTISVPSGRVTTPVTSVVRK